MNPNCGFYWIETDLLAGSAYPGECLEWLYNSKGIRAIVSLEPLKPIDQRKARQLGFEVVTIPIPDFTAGSLEQRKHIKNTITRLLTVGLPTLIHCQGGLGRTGMILAIYLVQAKGFSPQSAISKIRTLRPGSIEHGTGQEEAVYLASQKSTESAKT